MKRTISDYLKSPQNVHINLRTIISNTEFDETVSSENLYYYVVHAGNVNFMKNLRKNERIITLTELNILRGSKTIDCVPYETFTADNSNNFILYKYEDNLPNKPRAMLCNLSGYDLAQFSNKYINTELGRNILFGQNLRESLNKKSKTFKSMTTTIDVDPERFWYYNNGITIIAEEFNVIPSQETGSEIVVLNNFSIINGAQTVSTLGEYLKDSILDRDNVKLEKLKSVYVLTRIVEIKKDTGLRNHISIFNNTQNPISTRDMASNRPEQTKLRDWLSDNKQPRIYVEIRRGQNLPSNIRFHHHQKITNELLAQLAFSGFLKSPSIAKDKKSTIFNNDDSSNYNLNEYYHKIFNYDTESEEHGILFQKEKSEIDELLFLYYLHNETKKYLKNNYKSNIDSINTDIANGVREFDDSVKNEISRYKRLIEITNVCHFFNLSLIYEYKSQFDRRPEMDSYRTKTFDYTSFYNKNSDYRNNIIKNFASTFFQKTIKIIRDISSQTNITNWIRDKKSEGLFLDKLKDDLSLNNIECFEAYYDFIKNFKVKDWE